MVWDTVYERLQPYNVSVLGGRVTGVSEYRDSLRWNILILAAWQVGVGGLASGGGWFPDLPRPFVR